MTIMHPIDILRAKRTEVEDERTEIQAEAERIQARLLEISDIIAEYDDAIQREEHAHGVSIEVAKSDKLYPFIESKDAPITPANCTKECGNVTYGRKGNQLTIRTATSKYLNTSWEYVCNYYHNLPDKTRYGQIELNKDKRFALVSFYEHHPNFNCKIIADPSCKSKILVKEPIHIDIDTHASDKAEVDVSAY